MSSVIKVDQIQSDTGTVNVASKIEFPAGTVSAPSIFPTGDTNTGIFFPAADTIAFAEGGAEAMRIDSSGNVGIGTTSPNARLEILQSGATFFDSLTINNQNTGGYNNFLAFRTNVNGTDFVSGRIRGAASTANNGGLVFEATSSGTSVERMRITAGGDFQFNSGYGSVATAYGCRAWVNFNGTGTVAIRASGNVSSITDRGTGQYTVNFSTAMPDSNYLAMAQSGNNTFPTSNVNRINPYSRSTTSFLIDDFDGPVESASAPAALADREVIYAFVIR